MRPSRRSRPAATALAALTLALTVAGGIGCGHDDTNPRLNYVTFLLDDAGNVTTYDIAWVGEPVGALDPPCFGFETNLVSQAIQRPGFMHPDGHTDPNEQESNTYFRYTGNEDGEVADGCSGAFEAQFTYEGARFLLSGTITRPFPDMSEVDETDADPHATGTYSVEGSAETGTFTFWAYEYHGAAAPRGYPTEPLTR